MNLEIRIMKRVTCFIFFFIHIGIKAQEVQLKKMDSLFFLLEKSGKAMGSLSVFQNGESIYQKAIGYADVDRKIKATATTQYRVGSISKLFTATLVMQLVEEGKLSLQTKLSEFYPQLPNADQITVQQLLQHESGLFNITETPDFKEWMRKERSKEELLARIINNGSKFLPGEKAEYSNTNYILLTFIVEDVEKNSFPEILNKRIIKPLRLKNTYYLKSTKTGKAESKSYEKDSVWTELPGIHLSIPRGAGAIISTPEDLNQFINHLIKGKLVSENTISKMREINKKYAIGLNPVPFVEGVKMIGHTGGIDAFKSLLVYLPEQEMSVAFTFNGVDYPFKNIVMGIFNILLNKSYDLPKLEP